jgi:hypothetical protein
MTKQSTILRTDPLDQAIQTVIQDFRIPKNLRAALVVYQTKRAKLTNHGISVVPRRSTSPSTDSRVGYGCQPDDSRSFANGDGSILNGICTDLGQGMNIQMSIDPESLYWSVEINGDRHERITREDMESLIEVFVIITGNSLIRLLSARLQ